MSLFLCATAVSGYTLGAGGALQGRVATQSRFSEASRVAAEPLMGMSVDLTGKTAFVAGVADSTGYGWAICKVHRASPRSVSRRARPLRLVGGSLTLLGTPTHRQRLDVIWTEPGWSLLRWQALANAGCKITVGTWPPVLGIFQKSLASGKFDEAAAAAAAAASSTTPHPPPRCVVRT